MERFGLQTGVPGREGVPSWSEKVLGDIVVRGILSGYEIKVQGSWDVRIE